MSEELVTFEVNGQPLQARPGSMLIQALDNAGVTVPRFCYHKHLSVAANCRMCLVEVERAPKLMPACATPILSGMKVFTRTEKVLAAQKSVMEFLLINHPLDCPICDQGGECELQDVSLGFGSSKSDYIEIKRVVRDKDIGPLIETAMTRCIHCTRCVRFGEEIAGLRELGATGRSQHMEIGTYVEKTVSSELSGNVIDLCPVGALTAKPSRYTARAWEMRAHDSIAPHDSVGSHISVHTFDGRVVRVVPRENNAINESWISDRDRFSYEGLQDASRLHKPQIKHNGQWQEVSWQQALDTVAGLLRAAEPSQVGALAAPTSTFEEFFLFQKLMRGLGVTDIDHRLRQVDFSADDSAPAVPGLGMSLQELEQQQAVLLIGSNARHDQPLLNHRLRKAALAGANIMAINPRQVDFNYPIQQVAVTPLDMVVELAAVARAACELAGQAVPDVLAGICADVQVSASARQMATTLQSAERAVVLLGAMAQQHPALSTLRALASVIAGLTGAGCGWLPEANSVAACLAGVLPHSGLAGVAAKPGLPVADMLSSADRKAFVLMNAEVDDFANPQQALKAFKAAKAVVVLAPFASPQAYDYATVLLPVSTFMETAGTFVNAEGRWQTFKGVAAPPAEARPLWKVLRVLGNVLNVPEFDYVDTGEIMAELKLDLQGVKPDNACRLPSSVVVPKPDPAAMQRIGDVHMYRSDALVRRTKALQAMLPSPAVRMNPVDLDRLAVLSGELVRLSQGDVHVQLPAEADRSVPVGGVWVQSGTEVAQALGAAFGSIRVSKG